MAKRTNRTGSQGSSPRSSPRKPTSTAATRRDKWKPIFLATLAGAGNVSAAIKAAQVTRDTAYGHRKSDAKFAAGWDAALDEAMDSLEAEAWRRAKDGVEMPIVGEEGVRFAAIGPDGQYVQAIPKGADQRDLPGYKIVALMKKTYSDGLMTLLLRAGRPGKYRDNIIPGSGALGEGDEGIVLVHSAPPAPAAAPVPPLAAAKLSSTIRGKAGK